MNNLTQDVRYAIRGLLGNPGFAVVAILTIGIGIGANTTIFTWMRSVLLNPLPGAEAPQRIVALENTTASGDTITTSYLDYTDYRDRLKLVQNVVVRNVKPLVLGDEPRTERVWGELVSGNFFDLMGVQPQIGRFFSDTEKGDAQNAHPVVVISDSYWKSHFHGEASAIGATLRINRTPLTIIGVAPAGFHGSMAGLELEVWAPITMYGQFTHTGTWMLDDRNTRNFLVIARLAPGVTIEQARAEALSLAKFSAQSNPTTNLGIGLEVVPLWKSHFGSQAVLLAPITILMGASAVMLLIVCANVANLLLARATSRRKEFSIRLALGARPWRLVQQLLTETMIVSLAGALTGLIIASWLDGSLTWLAPSVSSPHLQKSAVDWHVLLYTTALAVGVAMLAGVAPAITAARANVNAVLKESGRSMAGGKSGRMRGMLVVSEVALAVVALVGAGLFLKNFEKSRGMNPGFNPEGVALAHYDISTAGYNAQQADAFCRRLRERLEQTPGVTAVSYDDSVPLGLIGGNWEQVGVDGYVPGPNESMKVYRDMVSPGYFALLQLPLVAGRDFDLHDDRESRRVMIVNEEFGRRYLQGRDPLGHKVRGWGQEFTIVGVAKNAKYRQITESAQPYFYIPIRQIYRPEYGLTVYARTQGNVNEAIAAIRRESTTLAPELLVLDAQPMAEFVSASLYGQKIAASLLSVLGGLSLLLAAVGLYSVMAYAVAQRTSEIGIRMTLGARPGDVLGLIIRQGMTLAFTGLLLGAGLAAGLARLAASALVAVSPADPGVYLGVAVFTAVIALLSAAIPASRALRVDPMVALRSE